MAERWRECRRVIARHSKSFDLASRLFPRPRRDEVAALYAWCRTCDDAVDLADRAARPAAVETLRRQLRGVYAGAAQDDPVLACFQEVVGRRRIPVEYPSELLAGMAMDIDGARYATLDELLVYCWRVAGTVGLMMCHVMGVSGPGAARRAAHLGIGMQLTNICRDVAEDWARGRVYLPAELASPALDHWLAERSDAPARPALPEDLRGDLAQAVLRLLGLADRYYASADEGLPLLEPRSALAVRTARLVYAEIGRRIEAQGGQVLDWRTVVPAHRKLALTATALGHYLVELRRGPQGGLAAPTGILGCPDALRLD